MNDLVLGLIIGAGIGAVLSSPLVFWGDQLFGFLEDQIQNVRDAKNPRCGYRCDPRSLFHK